MRVRILSFFTFHRAADRGPSVAAVVTIAVSVGAGGVGSWSSSSGFSLWYIVRAQVVVRVCREPRQQQAGTLRSDRGSEIDDDDGSDAFWASPGRVLSTFHNSRSQKNTHDPSATTAHEP